MDSITNAIVTALSAGAVAGLTETAKVAVNDGYTSLKDGYNKLKGLLVNKFGAHSEVVQAMERLEAKPQSPGHQHVLQEEMAAIKAEEDEEIVAAANQILMLVKSQQASRGKFVIEQDQATIQGQNIGNHQQIRQYFGKMPDA